MAAFLAGLAVGSEGPFASAAEEGRLLRELTALLDGAGAAWPGIDVAPESFVAYVAARIGTATDLSRVRAADLFIACACAQGNGAAVAALDAKVGPTLSESLRRMRLTDAQIDDVLQGLRRLLFTGDEVAPPRIAEYAGQGDLIGWLRVSATRSALKLLRREKREVPEPELLVERTAEGDPELFYMKALYRDAFKVAFQRALDSLSDREKNLLRQHVVDELSIDDLGRLYQVHRATAARWLASARETLLMRTRSYFAAAARVSNEECESVLRMVQSQLDATIRRRLEGSG